MSSHNFIKQLELKVPPVAVFVIAGFCAWLIDYIISMQGLLASAKNVIALLLLASGVFMGIAGVVSFKLAKTTVNPMKIENASALVSSGIFRLTRNPMYLGLLLVLLGFSARLENPYSLVSAAMFVLYMNHFQITPEEKALESIFGEDYFEYKKRVRRWI
jgi:protein-S-isoprenylcysteine O-methyltransferase Ste14